LAPGNLEAPQRRTPNRGPPQQISMASTLADHIGGYRSSDGARENTANVMASVVLGPDPPLGLSSSCPGAERPVASWVPWVG